MKTSAFVGAFPLQARVLASILAAAAVCIPSLSPAGGVVTECTEAALRNAMLDGGTVTLSCDGTIVLARPILVSASTTVDGSGRQVSISGGNLTGLFQVSSNVSFGLLNLELAAGCATNGAAILNQGGTVNLLGVTFSGNLATNQAANSAAGGAILNLFGTVSATNCGFYSNKALQGTNASAPALGGAVCNRGGILRLERCSFEACAAAGSVHNLADSLWGTAGLGGAVYNDGVLEARRCKFLRNAAGGGNGSDGLAGCGPFMGCPGGNGGDGMGGAVGNAGSMLIDSSLFLSNSASGAPGGTGGPGYFPVPDFGWPGGRGGNGGNGLGGGLFNNATGAVVNCTFAWNTGFGAAGGGGGPGAGTMGPGSPGNAAGSLCDTNGLLRITNCTIAHGTSSGNYFTTAPGGIWAGGTVVLNTLLASNAPGGNCSGTLRDLGHNLSSDGTCGFTRPSSLNNTDPRIGPLADTGGGTLTIPLLVGSPAIDAGDPSTGLATDQRGYPRPIGAGVDIGAFEFGSPASMLVSKAGPGVTINVLSVPNRSFLLLSSPDLADWLPVATNQFNGSGAASLSQPLDTQVRFYRVLLR